MYAIYLRKSRADKELENKEDVLLRHETALLELAKKRNYAIGKIFREVVSGETLAARPQMQELLSEVENGLWEGVLVMEVERLARGNTVDQGIVSQAFKFSNTLIITPSKIYNPANEFDEEYFEFGLFMSRREYKTINRRLAAGRLASCREGKYAGGLPPYGFDKVKLKGQKGWKLVPIPEETEVVRRIFSLYLSNEEKTGLQGIANRLNDENVPTRTGKEWKATQIKYILTNDAYIGKIHWQRIPQFKKSKDGAIVAYRQKSENYHIFEGMHDAVIDNETFNNVQQIMNERKKSPSNALRPMQNPFAGVLVCSVCGRPLKRKPADPRRPGHSASYCCATRNCPTVGCPVDIVEEKIIEGIRAWFSEYEINPHSEKPAPAAAYNTERIAAHNKHLGELQNQLTNTFTLLEQGIYDKDTFLSRQTILKCEINDTLEIIQKLKKEDEDKRIREEYNFAFMPQLKNLLDVWYFLPDAKSKNDLIKSLFYQIRYTKTTKGSRWNKASTDDFEIEFITRLPIENAFK